jgi:hypothetical protein
VYPRNAASPPRLSIGPVVQISDGAVQTAGVSVKVIPQGGTESAGAGTVAYTPTQGETDYVAVVFVASKTGCIPATVTVVTSASATAGYAGVDWSKITEATTAVALTGTTINTSQVVASVSGAVGSVTGAVGSVTAGVTVTKNNDKTGYSLTTAPPTAAAIADAVWDEAYAGHTTAGTFGKLMDTLRKANTVLEGTIQASPTPTTSVFKLSGVDYPTGALIGSVLWMNSGASQEQNSPILNTVNNGDGTITVTLENALVTAPSAGDTVLIDPTSHVHSVAEIQSGLATAANLLIAIDRVSYCLSALAGNCSTAQTATETYVLSIGGNTYTAAYSGLDGSGNRSTTTLTKA